MDNTTEKRHLADSLMRSTIEKIHEMVDTNAIVGQAHQHQDGVTLIPISRVSIGFGTGGGDYGKAQPRPSGGGGGGGVKIDPVAFLIVKDGVTRVLPVAVPPVTAVDRIVDMVPDLMDKAEKYLDKKKAEKEQETL